MLPREDARTRPITESRRGKRRLAKAHAVVPNTERRASVRETDGTDGITSEGGRRSTTTAQNTGLTRPDNKRVSDRGIVVVSSGTENTDPAGRPADNKRDAANASFRSGESAEADNPPRSRRSANPHEGGTAGGSRITSRTPDTDTIFRVLSSDDGESLDAYGSGSNTTFTDGRGAEDDGRHSGSHCEDQETLSERDSSAISSELSSTNERINVEFKRHFFPKDFYGNCIVGTDDSSTGSCDTSAIVRTIRRQIRSSSRECRRKTDGPTYDNDPAVIEAAYRRLIFDNAKESLAEYLIEGLFVASKRYRHDPFKCLGRWLLIQADNRDEDRTEQESTSNDDCFNLI